MKIHILIYVLLLQISMSYAQLLQQAEYFVDADPGFGNGTPIGIPNGSDIEHQFIANLSNISPGFHRLYTRVFEPNQGWSHTTSKGFFVLSAPISGEVEKLEIFYDEDPGFGQGSQLSPNGAGQLIQAIPIGNLPEGFHKLYVRAFQTGVGWSMTTSRPFYVLPKPKGQIVALEYFFDTDPGHGQGIGMSIAGGNELEFPLNISLAGLEPGFHQLYVRVQEASGAWSILTHRPFYFEDGENATGSRISEIEYRFLEDGEELMQYSYVVDPATRNLDLSFMPPVDDLELGGSYQFCMTVVQEDGSRLTERCVDFQYGTVPIEGRLEVFHVMDKFRILNRRRVKFYDSNFPWLHPNVIKICADGSNATEFEFKNESNLDLNEIYFTTGLYHTSGDAGLGGIFIEEEYVRDNDNQTITVKFTHPQWLGDNWPSRDDYVLVKRKSDDATIFSVPIRLFPAPVLMVHGLWGSPKGFNIFESYFESHGKFPSRLLRKANYERHNDRSFEKNEAVVNNNVKQLILQARDKEYSSGKVTIVAHSMGGIVSRLYTQSGTYNNDVYKLITLNTPHGGSHSANFLLSNEKGAEMTRTLVRARYSAIETGMEVIDPIDPSEITDRKYPVRGGAVHSLRVGETDMNSLNALGNYNRNNIPIHAMYSLYEPPVSQEVKGEGSLIKLVAAFHYSSHKELLDHIFNGLDNDLVVEKSSIIGNTVNNTDYSQISHSDIREDREVFDDLLNLIREHPLTGPGFKDNTFFYSPILTSDFETTIDEKSFNFRQRTNRNVGAVNIISPENGSFYATGDEVQIEISGTENISSIFYVIRGPSIASELDGSNTNPANFTYAIPPEASGTLKVLALGFDDDENAVRDSIFINVNITAALDSIIFDPPSLFLPTNETQAFSIQGFFADSITRYLDGQEGLEFEIENPSIARYVGNQVVKGLKDGQTNLRVRYQGLERVLPIDVYPGEDTTTTTFIGDLQEANELLALHAVPNPLKEESLISYELPKNGQVKLGLYNLNGKEIRRLYEGRQIKGKQEILLQKDGLTEGVYVVKLETKDLIGSIRLVVLP